VHRDAADLLDAVCGALTAGSPVYRRRDEVARLVCCPSDAGLTHGSGWVESFQFAVGWVGSTIAIVLKIWSAHSALSRLTDNSCIGLGPNFSTCSGLGWIGSVS